MVARHRYLSSRASFNVHGAAIVNALSSPALEAGMPKLDRLREEVAYFKLWLGVVVVTDIGLVGWLLTTADETDRLRTVLALLAIVVLSFGVVALHREIAGRLERIGKL